MINLMTCQLLKGRTRKEYVKLALSFFLCRIEHSPDISGKSKTPMLRVVNIEGCHNLVLKSLTARLVENFQSLGTVSLEDTILTTKPVLLPEDMRFSTAIKTTS
jgi:hypothetical protein